MIVEMHKQQRKFKLLYKLSNLLSKANQRKRSKNEQRNTSIYYYL